MTETKHAKHAYAYGRHPEDGFFGDCNSREEAVAEARIEFCLEPGDTVYTCRRIDPNPATYIPRAYWIIERAKEAADEDAGEWADFWLDCAEDGEAGADLDRMLGEAFVAWLKKHGQMPEFFIAEQIQKHVIPAEERHTNAAD